MDVKGWVGLLPGWLEVGIESVLGQRPERPLEQLGERLDSVRIVRQAKVAVVMGGKKTK